MDRSFDRYMSERLLECASELKVGNKEVEFEELVSSHALLTELSAAFRRINGCPNRYPEECRKELLRLRVRYEKRVVNGNFSNEASRRSFARFPSTWCIESEDDEDDFMPPTSKAKSATSAKEKSAESSKGKGAASTDAGGCVDGR